MSTGLTDKTATPAGLTNQQLLELYYFLNLTRRLEESLSRLYRQGKVIGGLYRSLGQEGESVACAYALGPRDIFSPLIRNLGAMLVKGARPVEVLRQYMAKATGPTAGREMNVHFNDLELGYLGQISHLGDMVPVMAGIALSFQMREEPRVGLVFVGDGATSTGAFHEGLGLAAVKRVPLVVVIENNGYAYSTPTRRQTAVQRLALKGKAYGVPGATVDGNDVLATYEVARREVEAARAGEGVRLIEVVTCRRNGHAEHDSQPYKSAKELADCEARDPIDRYRRRVLKEGWIGEDELEQVESRVTEELDAALAEAEHEPEPEGPSALPEVFADPASADELWFRRLNA